MAMTVKDVLTLRTRLAYLNSEAAKAAIPRVADLMAASLKWSKKEKAAQIQQAPVCSRGPAIRHAFDVSIPAAGE